MILITTLASASIVDPWGIQTEHQNEGCPRLYAFDKGRYHWDYIKKICEVNIHNQKYQNVHIIQNTIEKELSNIDEISFIYLDGNHDYSAVSTQLELLKDKMLPGACIKNDGNQEKLIPLMRHNTE